MSAHNSTDHLITILHCAFQLASDNFEEEDPRDSEWWMYMRSAFQQIKDDNLDAVRADSPILAKELEIMNMEDVL